MPPTTDLRRVDPAVRASLDQELAQGERLVWAAQPDPAAYARGAWIGVPFGVIFIAFSIFWMTGTTRAGAPTFFTLFGIPFVLIGLGVMTSPLWRRRQARRVIYALTDQRALVIEHRRRGTQVRSFSSAAVPSINRFERAGGVGDLVFQEQHVRGRRGSTHVVRRGFIGVPRVREVEELVRSTLLKTG